MEKEKQFYVYRYAVESSNIARNQICERQRCFIFSKFLVHSWVDHTGQESRFWLGLFNPCKMWTCILQIPVMVGAGRGREVGTVLYGERIVLENMLWSCFGLALPVFLPLLAWQAFWRSGQSAHSIAFCWTGITCTCPCSASGLVIEWNNCSLYNYLWLSFCVPSLC